MHVDVVATEDLGDRSYLVHDGERGVVIDAQRDLDRIEAVVDAAGVSVELVLETHIHNDYVTGGHALAQRTGGHYGVSAEDTVGFDRLPLRDGDAMDVGTLGVRVVATPGHTGSHLAYVVSDASRPDEPPAVFTGGSLLFGSVGRTDLVDPARTAELTRAQYRSVHRLADSLPAATQVFPTHGFGSFCSSGLATGGDASTIGTERVRNDAFLAADERSFVERLIANLGAYPAYYVHMAPLNRLGPGAADLTPPELADARVIAERIAAGEWVIDVRHGVAFAADHLAGTIGMPLGAQFATYLGWLVPWEAPVTLIGDSFEQLAEAQRQLSRIGVEPLRGAAAGPLDALQAPGQLRNAYPCVGFDAVLDLPDTDLVLDVRGDEEHATSAIAGSLHVPVHSLLSRLDALPPGRLWVHCASGYRAAVAASLLDRAGRDVLLVDDDFSHAVELGLVR